jgi:hypothetical protein
MKTEFSVVLLYNFKIIFYDKYFENIQAKHATELISFEIQCFVKFNLSDTHISWKGYRQWTKVFARFQFTLYISYKTIFSKYYLEINSR